MQTRQPPINLARQYWSQPPPPTSHSRLADHARPVLSWGGGHPSFLVLRVVPLAQSLGEGGSSFLTGPSTCPSCLVLPGGREGQVICLGKGEWCITYLVEEGRGGERVGGMSHLWRGEQVAYGSRWTFFLPQTKWQTPVKTLPCLALRTW